MWGLGCMVTLNPGTAARAGSRGRAGGEGGSIGRSGGGGGVGGLGGGGGGSTGARRASESGKREGKPKVKKSASMRLRPITGNISGGNTRNL